MKLDLKDNPANQKVYTVSEINRQAKYMLENQFANIWLEGEISNFKHHSSGHMYLSLKDDKAQISAVFFSRSNQLLKFKPKDGLKVTAFGKISLYENRGQYQFYIDRMEPKGLGELQLAFLQLKEKLEKEGLFDESRKRPIPRFPVSIGVVTSPTGAAIRDILNVLERRFQGVRVLIYPARVQGEGAADEIVQGIKVMQGRDVDVLIVGRGGGSIEDLWCFNEERVARAIAASEKPIISAVGHEIDWTIADFVADKRAPTPSAAAELVVQNREEIQLRIQDFKARLMQSMDYKIENAKQILDGVLNSYAFKQPLLLVEQFSQKLDELLRQQHNYLKAILSDKKQTFQAVIGKLEALSPLGILGRGYSLSFDEKGKLIKSVDQISVGEKIQTRLNKGSFVSEVLKKESKEV